MGLNDDKLYGKNVKTVYYYISVYSIVMIIRVRINIYHNQIRKV